MRRLAVAVGAVAVLAVGGIAWAAIPDPGGVIQGCFDRGGNLKVVDALPCPKGFTSLPWNQTGVPGTPGADGLTSTYIRSWQAQGTDLGDDGVLTSGEFVQKTIECDDANDQLTFAGGSGAIHTGANPGILPVISLPSTGNGSTTRDRALITIMNDTGGQYIFPGFGYIICASVN